jgi:hypothetical protein
LDLWLARVFGVTSIRAWCSCPTEKRYACERAGMTAGGRLSHLAIRLNEQTQCRRCCPGRSLACSMAVMRSEKEGSRSVVAVVIGIAGVTRVMGIRPQLTVMDGDWP